MYNSLNKFYLILLCCKRIQKIHSGSQPNIVYSIPKRDVLLSLKEMLFKLTNINKVRKFLINDVSCKVKSCILKDTSILK